MPNSEIDIPLVKMDNETHQSNNTETITAVIARRFIFTTLPTTNPRREPANAIAAHPLAWNKVHHPWDKTRLETIVAMTAKAIPRRAPKVAPITKHIIVSGWTFGNGSNNIRLAAAATVILDSTRISLLAE